MNKLIITSMCFTLVTHIMGDGNTVSEHISTVAKEIQYGIDNLLTKVNSAPRKNRSKYIYEFTDQNVIIEGLLEFKKIKITAENTAVEIFTVANETTGEGVTLIGYPDHSPSFKLYPENGNPIFLNILTDTEFKRLPKHNLRIKKDYSFGNEPSFVQWGIANNHRVLFSPTGYKSSSLDLPVDIATHLIEGQYVDTDITLNGICLINGVVYIVADTQDVTIHLNEYTWLMNATDEIQCALILLANVDRKITFVVNESMEWRSHLNAPFIVVQGGPGKIEVKIVADDND